VRQTTFAIVSHNTANNEEGGWRFRHMLAVHRQSCLCHNAHEST
jgi:hypothetical protein